MMYLYPSCLQFTYLMHSVWSGLRPFCDLPTIIEHRNHSHLLNIGEGGTGKTMLQKGLGAIYTIDEYDTIQRLQGGNNADAHTKSLIAINEIESLAMLGTADMKNLLDVTNTSTVNIKYQNNKKRPQGTLVVMQNNGVFQKAQVQKYIQGFTAGKDHVNAQSAEAALMRVAIIRHYDPRQTCGTTLPAGLYFRFLSSLERQRNADWDLRSSIALMLGAFTLYMSNDTDYDSFFRQYPDLLRNAHLLLTQLRQWPFFKLLTHFYKGETVRSATMRQYNKYCLYHTPTENFASHE